MGGGRLRLWVPVGVVAVVVVGLVGVAARSNGSAAERHRLRSGTAWLVDARGDVSLVDGVSGAVLSSVTATDVASEAQSATVVNGESGAFVTFPASGRVLGVDSRTFLASHRVRFSTPGDDGLRVLVSDERVVVVAGAKHTMTPVAGHSLDTVGPPVVFRGSPEGLVMTPKGVVWGLGSGSDRLLRYGPGTANQAGPDSGPSSRRLLLAGGAPVAADPGGGVLVRFDPVSGRADSTLSCLGLPPGGEVDFVGADDGPQVVALVHGANNLVAVADFAEQRCGGLIPLDAPGADPAVYGAPALLDGRVYVPDRTAGQLVVIDLARATTQRVPLPVGADANLRVFIHDGLVWFDVTGGNQAGTLTRNLQLININKQPPTTPQAPPDTANPTPATTTTTATATTVATGTTLATTGSVDSTSPSTHQTPPTRPPVTRPPTTPPTTPQPTPVVDTLRAQTISFPTPGGGSVKYATGLTIPLGATATSGLPVTYSVVAGNCQVQGSSALLTGAGGCTLEASQAGMQQLGGWAPAPPVDASFTILKGDSSFSLSGGGVTVFVFGTVTLSVDNVVGVQTFHVGEFGPCGAPSPVGPGPFTVTITFPSGTCTITVTQTPGDANFNEGGSQPATIFVLAPETVPPPPPPGT